MTNELTTLDSEQLKELVASLPPKKRAVFSKAAKAACQHLKDSKANYGKAYDLASAMVENWWLLGLEIPRLGLSEGGRPTKTCPQGDRLTLGKLGINRNQSARCQKLAEMSKPELDGWIESKRDETTYYLPALRQASEHVHVSENTGQPEWYTPQKYIDAARNVLGQIDLDPASTDIAQEVVKADVYYTLEDDGLEHDWIGRVWMNPPYAAGVVDDFMAKLTAHVVNNDIKSAITLTNNATDTAWFQSSSSAANVLCLITPRVKFLDEDGNAVGAPLQGQATLYFGKAVKKFCNVFGAFGSCWVKP